MSNVLALPQWRSPKLSRLPTDPPCKIIIFPGVRIEWMREVEDRDSAPSSDKERKQG
ncbi:hypothetical protein [Rhodoligotrophos defluvii]|uniref:hypothetical protein n=1 Tax=Rhodoligotrophos defluvii TaxID=2561934 RepID=UPI0014855E63|nr:hypothetical protein [Rhodoligotrophos defluvii]